MNRRFISVFRPLLDSQSAQAVIGKDDITGIILELPKENSRLKDSETNSKPGRFPVDLMKDRQSSGWRVDSRFRGKDG